MANLLLRFLVELFAIGAVAYWGFKTGDGAGMKALLGVGAPLLLVVIWGTSIAPKAAVEVPTAVWLGLQGVVFGSAAMALASVASPALATTFLLVVANGGVMAALGS